MTLTNKIAIITGGTGGLGSAVVAELLAAGATVSVPMREAGELNKLRERLRLTADAPLSGAVVDLTNEEQVQAYVDRLAAEHGGIDILINIAGGFDGGKPVHKAGWAIWEAQLATNVQTTVNSCAAAIPHMIARGGGSIITVSARAATQAGKNNAAYAASKRAVLQLTEALAAELRDEYITVNAILPSTIDTPANRKSMPDADYERWVKPAEIAAVIRFLVGPEARIISGGAIPVYGRA
jgi:NAD(P)-dependent dehydrogenase (short-subunit alcohol dehydrogenase family)